MMAIVETRSRWFAWALVLSASLALGSALPKDDSLQVNQVTPGQQASPRVAFDGGGRGLVVWDSDGVDGDETGIAARLFDADGQPLSDEIVVNSTVADVQIQPAVAGLPGGGFVVVWESYEFELLTDGIHGQRVGSDGRLVGAEFRVDDGDGYYHLRPDIETLPGGGFVVVWDDYYDVIGRHFDAAGTPTTDEEILNARMGELSNARVEGRGDGSFTVVWSDSDGLDGDGAGVLARCFDAQGEASEPEFVVNTNTEGDQYLPAIAVRSDGSFVVAWETFQQAATGDGAFGQFFDSTGLPSGGETRIDGGNSVFAGGVAATAIEEGFAIVWDEPREGQETIFMARGRRFSTTGVGRSEFDVGADRSGNQMQSSIAGSGDAALVAWTEGAGAAAGSGLAMGEEDVYLQAFEIDNTVPSCACDCNGDGRVTVAELVRAVNINLENQSVDVCPAADVNGDGRVAVNELVQGVNNNLNGCPA